MFVVAVSCSNKKVLKLDYSGYLITMLSFIWCDIKEIHEQNVHSFNKSKLMSTRPDKALLVSNTVLDGYGRKWGYFIF